MLYNPECADQTEPETETGNLCWIQFPFLVKKFPLPMIFSSMYDARQAYHLQKNRICRCFLQFYEIHWVSTVKNSPEFRTDRNLKTNCSGSWQIFILKKILYNSYRNDFWFEPLFLNYWIFNGICLQCASGRAFFISLTLKFWGPYRPTTVGG